MFRFIDIIVTPIWGPRLQFQYYRVGNFTAGLKSIRAAGEIAAADAIGGIFKGTCVRRYSSRMDARNGK